MDEFGIKFDVYDYNNYNFAHFMNIKHITNITIKNFTLTHKFHLKIP